MASFVYNSSESRNKSALSWLHSSNTVGIDQCQVRILEWPNVGQAACSTKLPVSGLISRARPKMRIIFAPSDVPSEKTFRGVQELFSYCRIPAEFVAERLHDVTHSFGWQQETEAEYVCWLHTLCKNIELVPEEDAHPRIKDPRDRPPGPPSSQADGTWTKSGYFMRWKQPPTGRKGDEMVELIIFSPSRSLQANMERLITRPDWEQTLVDPFNLLILVLDDLFQQVNTAINNVSTVFRHIEQSVLNSAQRERSESPFDFVGIHNVAKHIIYLRESSNAAYSTASRVCQQHEKIFMNTQNSLMSNLQHSVEELLQHKLTLLEGSKLRVQSIESRAQNAINLAFNTVNQHDSRILKSDSQSMRGIAIVTMLFLPAATVGSVCGSQFFNFDTTNHKTMVSTNFWTFWAMTMPLTFIVFVVYWVWRRLGKQSLMTGAKAFNRPL